MEERREGDKQRGRERETKYFMNTQKVYSHFVDIYITCIFVKDSNMPYRSAPPVRASNYKAVTLLLPSRCLTQLNMFYEVAAETPVSGLKYISLSSWTGSSLCLTKLFTSVAMPYREVVSVCHDARHRDIDSQRFIDRCAVHYHLLSTDLRRSLNISLSVNHSLFMFFMLVMLL